MSGPTSPRSGWRQRSSASTPVTAAVRRGGRPAGSAARAGRRRHRALEVGAQLEPLEHALVHGRLEQAVAALAVALGDVHRGVRVADQLVGVDGGLALGDRDAEAAADEQLLALERSGIRERLEDALGGVGGVLRARRRPRAGPRTRRRRSGPRCRSRGCSRRGAWRPRAGPRRRRRGRGCR